MDRQEVATYEVRQFRAKFLAALRSGDYSQAQGQLRWDGKFCCLGVACDLKDPELWKPDGENGSWAYAYTIEDVFGDREFTEGYVLTEDVSVALGLSGDVDPVLVLKALGESVSAAECNDIYNLDFLQIADLFEYLFEYGEPLDTAQDDQEGVVDSLLLEIWES